MKWISVLFSLSFVTGLVLAADKPTTRIPPLPAPAPSTATAAEERYLFIVDTSASMQRIARESRQALFDLVYWGAEGHMQAGDTFGIWSVDDELHAGEFPMQTWRAEQQLDLATKASVFLKDKTYRKQANYGKLSISLLAMVMNVKDVNLFLITDAENPLVGLPMDEQIRQACAARAKQRAAQNKPFVIYLSARGGEIRSATVAIAGENFNLPPRASKPALARSRSATPTNADAKKPAGRIVSLGYVDPEGTESRPAAAESSDTPTRPAPVMQPNPPAPKAPAPKATPTPETAAVIQSEVAKAAPINRGEAAAVMKAEVAEAISPTERPATKTGAEPVKPPAANSIAQTPPAPIEPHTPLVEKPALTVAARERQPNVPLATAAPVPEPILSARTLFIISGALAVITISLAIAFIRRLPGAPRGSIISKSMDDAR